MEAVSLKGYSPWSWWFSKKRTWGLYTKILSTRGMPVGRSCRCAPSPSKFHREGRAFAFGQRGLVDQVGGDDVFHGVAHRFVNGDVLSGFSAGTAPQDHFAQLCAA